MALFDLRATSIERYFSFYFSEFRVAFLPSTPFKANDLFLMAFWEIFGCSLDRGYFISLATIYFVSLEVSFCYFDPYFTYFDSLISLVDSFLGFLGPLLILSSFKTY